jgi:hypothetical protein
MIHFTCDRCRKIIETEHETRYTIKIEIKATESSAARDFDEDRDHLLMIEEIIDQLDDPDAELAAIGGVIRRRTFDLCTECHDVFLQNPLSADAQTQLGFSDN